MILNQQLNYEIYHSTVDNLISDVHTLAYTTGYAENEVFHLGNMLKQDDRNDFFTAMDKEVSGHNEGNH